MGKNFYSLCVVTITIRVMQPTVFVGWMAAATNQVAHLCNGLFNAQVTHGVSPFSAATKRSEIQSPSSPS